ncbi:hypothetical protein TSUD_393850 [Trifolium subterraneum]|uniref:Homogentisate phytyltransferase n=1 Tax=Trifolium subterraneum TaxID=3900 RepID=A0A2Z6NCQ6_TRISU|nr:hypothetical protein TSUD_393850 [Trifolium subterraneum]
MRSSPFKTLVAVVRGAQSQRRGDNRKLITVTMVLIQGGSNNCYNGDNCFEVVLLACSEVGAVGSDPPFPNKVVDLKDAFWRFLRPHTIRGTALGSAALVSRALIENSNLIKWSLLLKAFSGLFALICGNGYIVGINQIYDISIDKYVALLHISCQVSIFCLSHFSLGLNLPVLRLKVSLVWTRIVQVRIRLRGSWTVLSSWTVWAQTPGSVPGIGYSRSVRPVNKPYLPIAAGDLSVQSAWFLVIFFAAAGLLIVGLNFGPFIFSLYSFGLFLGTIYSVPPLRMKRFPVAAFLIIATVRGFLLNFGVYYATRAALGLAFEWSSPVVFITTFVTFFALVIAITKDLPDVEGDRRYQISTFATKLGVRNIAFLGSGILLMNYVVTILAAIYMPQAFRRWLLIPAHTIFASSLIYQVQILEKANYTKLRTAFASSGG